MLSPSCPRTARGVERGQRSSHAHFTDRETEARWVCKWVCQAKAQRVFWGQQDSDVLGPQLHHGGSATPLRTPHPPAAFGLRAANPNQSFLCIFSGKVEGLFWGRENSWFPQCQGKAAANICPWCGMSQWPWRCLGTWAGPGWWEQA